MEKLSKLEFDSEKILKNEELIALKGGSGTGTCVKCFSDGGIEGCMGFLGSFYNVSCPEGTGEAVELCQLWYSGSHCATFTCGSNC
jgi:hypothetical protein